MGYQAGKALTTAGSCVFIGHNAGLSNTTGVRNTFMGQAAGINITTGNDNIFIGEGAGYPAQTPNSNTVVGSLASRSLTTGAMNTAVGYNSLYTNTTGSENAGVGISSLYYVTTGIRNAAVGGLAGYKVTTGHSNTFLGFYAGGYGTSCVITGVENTLLGAYSRVSSDSVNGELVVGRYALGQGAGTGTIGYNGNGVHIALNNSTTSWSKHSDERLKENIVDSTAGLSFINDLRPVTYTWKAKKDISEEFENHYDADSNEPVQGMEDTTYHGFLAQEVKSTIDNHPEIENGHAIWRESPDGIQNLADGALIPMLVKALQEADAKIEALTTRLEAVEG